MHDATRAEAIDAFNAAVDALRAAGVTPVDVDDARGLVVELETVAALAVRLSSTTCYRPGCHVPVTDCQSDHLTPWSTGRTGEGGGSTNPRNGGPACGRHNRLRTHGYHTWRDPTGTWHITRPDGTRIT